jgi:hypothetical protein
LKSSALFTKTLLPRIFMLLGLPCLSFGQSPRLTFSDLNLGLNAHFTSYQDSIIYPRYFNQAGGVSFRYQTSMVANYLHRGKTKRFQVVDIVAGELTGGLFQSTDQRFKQPGWFAFRFDLGAGSLWNINDHHQLGLNWILMRFANDFISDYVGGSELQIRYRYKRVALELGTINRKVRVGGIFESYIKEDEGSMYSIGMRYLQSGKNNLGFRVELFNLPENKSDDRVVAVRLYYGYYY